MNNYLCLHYSLPMQCSVLNKGPLSRRKWWVITSNAVDGGLSWENEGCVVLWPMSFHELASTVSTSTVSAEKHAAIHA